QVAMHMTAPATRHTRARGWVIIPLIVQNTYDATFHRNTPVATRALFRAPTIVLHRSPIEKWPVGSTYMIGLSLAYAYRFHDCASVATATIASALVKRPSAGS